MTKNKISELVEGENSSLKKTYDNAVKSPEPIKTETQLSKSVPVERKISKFEDYITCEVCQHGFVTINNVGGKAVGRLCENCYNRIIIK